MVEDAISFWTDIQRYEDMLVADASSYCFAPLSELYRKLGLLDDAISVAQKGCALHADFPGGYLALGTACYDKGLTAEARQALERVVALHPGHLQALKLLGQLYVEQGEIGRARQALVQVLQQDPDDLESTLLLNTLPSPAPGAQLEELPDEELLGEELPDEELTDELLDEELPYVELLEEAEVVEDLTEVLDEPAPPEPAAPVAGLASQGAEIAQLEEVAARAPLAPLNEADDYWAIETLDESAAPEIPQPSRHAQPARQPDWAAAPKAEKTASEQHTAHDPLTTATLAELYASQGFLDKALNIYRELLIAHPSNQQYQLRCAEVLEMKQLQQQMQLPTQPVATPEAPAAQSTGPAPQGDVEAELQRWLENIRRRRDGV